MEDYEVIPGTAQIRILEDLDEHEYIYFVSEPKSAEDLSMRAVSMADEVETMIPVLAERGAIGDYFDLDSMISVYLRTRHPELNDETRSVLMYAIQKKHAGFGRIHVPILDPEIEDISCNGPGIPVFVYHRRYGSLRSNIVYPGEAEVASALVKMAQLCGKEISVSNPVLDGITSSGHRVQGLYGKEVSPHGSAYTIRLFREKPFTPVDLVNSGAASAEMITYFWYMVEYLNSALIVGPPAVGKTSTLNAIMMLIPPNTKVFSIEETREINIMHPNWVASSTRESGGESNGSDNDEGRIDLFELVKVAMRQRPTYIVVGEVRGREAYSLFQAMSTGHTTYSTMHADSMTTMMNRLESEPLNVPRILLSYLRTVVIDHFIRKGQEVFRRITEVNEISGVDSRTNEVVYNRVFSYNSKSDSHSFSGSSILLSDIAKRRNMPFSEFMDEFRGRERVIQYMSKSGRDGYREIADTISRYYNNREALEQEIRDLEDGKRKH